MLMAIIKNTVAETVLLDFSELEEKRKLHLFGSGKEKQEEYKNKGNLTAFERMNTLMDSGTFVELDPFVTHECYDFWMEKKRTLGDGVVTGYGTINGRLVSFGYAGN